MEKPDPTDDQHSPTGSSESAPSLSDAYPATPEVIAHPRADLVAAYKTFNETLGPNVDTVYHPCGANDSSPSEAFPDSRVIYAEWGPEGGSREGGAAENVRALREAGLEAYFEDANTFDPGPVDVVILRNPAISSRGPVGHLKPGGYALVNNCHGNASELHRQDDEFELVGIVHTRTPDGQPVLDTDSPKSYWETVETDEEFRQSPGYNALVAVGRTELGTDTPSLEQFQTTLARLREEYPDALNMDGELLYGPQMRIFPTALPRKKGHLDDLFVFRRKPVEASV